MNVLEVFQVFNISIPWSLKSPKQGVMFASHLNAWFSFWTPGLPEGVLSNHLRGLCVCQSVRPSVRPSLDISETVYWFFPIFCMKLEHDKGTKVTEPDF